VVHVSVGGDRVRIRLTNAFGADGVMVDRATVGVRSSGAALVAGTERQVTFGGRTEVVLPAGSEVLSDPVPLTVAFGQDVAVSLYVPGSTGSATRHPLAMATSYLATGDHAGDAGADYDSGDHLHPDDAGYQAMADAIDPRLLSR
jgi:hypothetical protein